MKKLTIIGMLVVIGAVCLLLHRQHVESIARFDSDFRQGLPGTWLMAVDDPQPQSVGMAQSVRWTNIFAADGSFTCLSWFRHTDRTNTYRQTGAWVVKDGHLVLTIKTSTNPTQGTPFTNSGRIVSADGRTFIVRWPGSTNEGVWQKVIQ